VLVASTAPSEAGDTPGVLVPHADRLALTTSEGRLVLDELQLAGKRALAGDEFLRGQPRLAGASVVAAVLAGSPR
jgi:methionyl-tRNA formyltransferase